MLDTGPHPELPPGLQSRLRALYRTNQPPDAALRRALVDLAGEQHAARRRLRAWRAVGLAAAVALCGAAVTLWAPWRSGAPTLQLAAARDPMDLNFDGVIDMLDALAARRTLDSGGDVVIAGVRGTPVIDAIAQRAVRLPARPHGAGGDA